MYAKTKHLELMKLNIKLISFVVSDILILMLLKTISSLLKSLTLKLNATWRKDKDPVNKFLTWQIICICILLQP